MYLCLVICNEAACIEVIYSGASSTKILPTTDAVYFGRDERRFSRNFLPPSLDWKGNIGNFYRATHVL